MRALSKQHIPQFVLPEYGMDESERLTWSEAYSILAKLTEAGVAVPPRPVPDVVVERYDADVEDDGRGMAQEDGSVTDARPGGLPAGRRGPAKCVLLSVLHSVPGHPSLGA